MKPSNKIMKLSEYDDSVTFRAACACNDPDHDLWITIEQDEEFGCLDMSFIAKVYYYDNNYDSRDKFYVSFYKWLKNIKKRVKCSIKLLLTGYLEMETTFMMQEEKDIDDFVSALQQGMWKIMNWKKKVREENKCGGTQTN